MLFNISEVLIMNFGSKFCDFVTSTTRDGKGRKVVFGKGVWKGIVFIVIATLFQLIQPTTQ